MTDTAERPEDRRMEKPEAAPFVAVARLALGLAQGLILYALYRAADEHGWPANDRLLFVPFTLIAFFAPLILLQGLTAMRLRTLFLWALAASIVAGLLGAYDTWREWPAIERGAKGLRDANLPSFALFFFLSAAIFIGHSLVAGADAARKFVVPYTLYFAAAWKLGVQFALSVVFTGLFWLVLWLGSVLFELIGIDFLSRVIEKAWFAIPATAMALSIAVHVADVRASMIESVRAIVLALLSWLLPLIAFFAGAFLIAVLVMGLETLWNTRAAAAILLTTAGALVFFANAAFQDGVRQQHKALRIASLVAGIALLPLTAIAAYAIILRIGQHGWTADRIVAVAVTIVALVYALGYLWAVTEALRKRSWHRAVEKTNIYASFLVIGVIVLLFSPILDPMRIAVASQVARLESGKIAPKKFDYYHLRFSGGRFGHDALTRLSQSKNPEIAESARDMLMGTYGMRAPEAAEIARQIKVYPADRKLPDTLLKQKWDVSKMTNLPSCFLNANIPCEAFAIDLNGDGRDEYLFIWGQADDGWDATVMGADTGGVWAPVATLPWPHCKAAREAFRKGQYAVVAPLNAWRGIDAGETNFQPMPVIPAAACP